MHDQVGVPLTMKFYEYLDTNLFDIMKFNKEQVCKKTAALNWHKISKFLLDKNNNEKSRDFLKNLNPNVYAGLMPFGEKFIKNEFSTMKSTRSLRLNSKSKRGKSASLLNPKLTLQRKGTKLLQKAIDDHITECSNKEYDISANEGAQTHRNDLVTPLFYLSRGFDTQTQRVLTQPQTITFKVPNATSIDSRNDLKVTPLADHKHCFNPKI